MKKTFFHFLFLTSIFLSPLWVSAEPYLRIVQPFEGDTLPPVESSFVFGSVLPATATVTINGVPVEPHSNGGFLVMIPFEEGRFEITGIASTDTSTETVTRRVLVSDSPKTFSKKEKRIKPMAPVSRVVVRHGDIIDMVFQGAPGGTAHFKIPPRKQLFPMTEVAGPVAGIYRGAYVVQPTDKFDNADVTFILKRADRKKITKKAGARIIVQRRSVPRFVSTKDNAVLLTGPGSSYGYHMFLEPGVQLEVTGEYGEFLRVSLSEKMTGWIKKSVATPMPGGTPRQRSVSRNIRVERIGNSTLLKIPLKYRHAHRIEQTVDPHVMKLTMYGLIPDTDRIRYLSQNSVVKEITWVQNEPDTVTFNIETTQKNSWGYDVRYEDDAFFLEIRHAPDLSGWGNSLKGLRVALDAGHTAKNFGTIGPWGNTEFSVNVKTSRVIKDMLEKRGAEVLMIQDGSKDISLRDRVALAWNERAHVFISIHCDATGEGNDPREKQGFSVHYYHPQSRIFAEEVHRLYRQGTDIRDQGLWRSNLAVCRMTQMPSILLEQAYLILPEFEEKLLTPRFQRTVAEIVADSIMAFLNRARQ